MTIKEHAEKWCCRRAEILIYQQVELGLDKLDISAAMDQAIREYTALLQAFAKPHTGQLTEKDVAYYEQTRPTA